MADRLLDAAAGLDHALGHRQVSIPEYLWTHGPQSVSDLHRFFFLEGEELAHTIVFAELGRLLKKGLVIKGSDGGSVSSDRAELAELRRLLAQSTPQTR